MVGWRDGLRRLRLMSNHFIRGLNRLIYWVHLCLANIFLGAKHDRCKSLVIVNKLSVGAEDRRKKSEAILPELPAQFEPLLKPL